MQLKTKLSHPAPQGLCNMSPQFINLKKQKQMLLG